MLNLGSSWSRTFGLILKDLNLCVLKLLLSHSRLLLLLFYCLLCLFYTLFFPFVQSYCATVHLVRQVTSEDLLSRLKARNVRNPDHSRASSKYLPVLCALLLLHVGLYIRTILPNYPSFPAHHPSPLPPHSCIHRQMVSYSIRTD